ncbi:MAG TPA: ATP-binding protein [Herbaspirillum sp.]|nr:ATP-binding protein [Herbaspirillum sp.]
MVLPANSTVAESNKPLWPLWLLWPIAAIVLGALLWSMTFSKIALEQAGLDRETLREASSFADIYARRLTYLIEQADQTTRLIKYRWENFRANMSAESLAKQGIFPSSKHLHVIIADRNGNQIMRSAPGTFPNLADRDYFTKQKNSKSDMLLVGMPETERGIGTSVLKFSRRLNTPDGQFDGVVILEVDQAFFSDFFDSRELGKSGLLCMMGPGGSLQMAMIAGVAHSPAHPLLTSIPISDAEGARLLNGTPWFADRRARFVAWSPLKSAPFVALVGLAKDEAYVRYEKTWAAYRNYALIGTILLFFSALVATFLSVHLTFRKRQLERIREDYGIAAEGGKEAFYLFRVLRNKGGMAIDFEILDCNELGAAFCNMSRTQLLGKKISLLFKDLFFDKMATFRTAMEIGFLEDEYQVPANSCFRMQWLHRKMMRTHNGLVLIMRDISEAKAYQESMRRLATRLTTTLESITDAFYTLDRQWRFTYINREAEILLRKTRSDLMEKVIWVARKEAGVDSTLYREFHHAVQHCCTVEFEEFYPVAGLWLNVRAYPSEEGLAVYICNITDRKCAEQAILSSQTELRILYDRLQTIREEERVALAREVHDQLGQILSAAKIDIKLLEDDIRPVDAPLSRRKISKELRSARLSIEKAIQSVREIAADLRSPELEAHGLFATLKWHTRDFERRTRIKCSIDIPDTVSEPSGLIAIVLFRIFQEATTNILRHAKAGKVWISLDRRGAMILLRVRDNGIGIGPALARSHHSMGIKGMRERVTIVKGRLLVSALRPQGTLISVRIPIQCHAPDAPTGDKA